MLPVDAGEEVTKKSSLPSPFTSLSARGLGKNPPMGKRGGGGAKRLESWAVATLLPKLPMRTQRAPSATQKCREAGRGEEKEVIRNLAGRQLTFTKCEVAHSVTGQYFIPELQSTGQQIFPYPPTRFFTRQKPLREPWMGYSPSQGNRVAFTHMESKLKEPCSAIAPQLQLICRQGGGHVWKESFRSTEI